MDIWGAVLAGMALLVALALALMILVRQTKPRFGVDAALDVRLRELIAAQNEIAGRFGQAIETQSKQQGEMQRTLAERLEALDQRLGTNLKESAQKTAESLGELRTRLGVIDEAQKNIVELSSRVVSLQQILSDKQTRGAYGQEHMETIVSDQLPPSLYKFQAKLSNNSRPDCLIYVPNMDGAIVVDSKFPLEAFEQLRKASTEEERKNALAQVRSDIQTHVKDIATKYLIPGETHAPALMFVPSESIYAELHASFSELIQKARRAQVIIVSPNIFMLAINTIQSIVRDAQMREQASRIQHEVVMLLQDVKRLGLRAVNLRQHFDRANKDIGEMETSMNKITSRAERIEQVELPEGDAKDRPQLPET